MSILSDILGAVINTVQNNIRPQGATNPQVGGLNSQGQRIVGRTASPGEQPGGGGLDLGSVIQALVGGQLQQQQNLMQHFGFTSKPMRRLDISGQDMADPNRKSSLDQFYQMNAGRAGRDASGAPLQGNQAFANRIGPLADPIGPLADRTNSGIDATNRGFTGGVGKFGTSGNDATSFGGSGPLAPLPQVSPDAIAQDVWNTLKRNPNAFGSPSTGKPKAKQPKKSTTSNNIWRSFAGSVI